MHTIKKIRRLEVTKRRIKIIMQYRMISPLQKEKIVHPVHHGDGRRCFRPIHRKNTRCVSPVTVKTLSAAASAEVSGTGNLCPNTQSRRSHVGLGSFKLYGGSIAGKKLAPVRVKSHVFLISDNSLGSFIHSPCSHVVKGVL